MSCEDFETQLADALGGELSGAGRARFEGHLAMCATCRKEYQSLAGTVEQMRSLSGSSRVSEAILRQTDRTAGLTPKRGRMGGLMRYAASVLVAFGAGYAFHNQSDASGARSGSVAVDVANPSGPTLGTALASVHQRQPAGSGLSNAMIAMFATH